MWLGNNARSMIRACGATARTKLAILVPWVNRRPEPIIAPPPGGMRLNGPGGPPCRIRGQPAADEVGARNALTQDIAVDALIDDHHVDVLTVAPLAAAAPARICASARSRSPNSGKLPSFGHQYIGKAGRKIDRDMDIAHE